MTTSFVLRNATLFDGVTPEPREGATVVVADGLIQEVSFQPVTPPSGATVWDCAGLTLMPGLIDAHVHLGAVDVAFGTQHHRYAASHIAYLMADRARQMLRRGYTTVRDAGGADWGLRQAIDDGLIPGPRLQISHRILSQTGGHGDMRARAEDSECRHSHADFGMVFSIADGPDAVRRAVREQVRKGVDFIKVMASGGAASPTDKLECSQYSREELAVIVEEAEMGGVYVAAHALPAAAIARCVEAGARSIEHGNFLDRPTAELMASRGTWLVPTMATYVMASRHPEKYDDPPEITAKIKSAADGAIAALEAAVAAGVNIASGSDLLGDEMSWINHEHEIKATVMGHGPALLAATSRSAEMLGLGDVTGRIAPGLSADLLCVTGDPLADVAVLGAPGALRLVMAQGRPIITTLD